MKNRNKAIKKLLIAATVAILVWSNVPTANAAPASPQKGIVLVIDAGHGGADGGAVSPSGVKESEINLDIALKLDELMAFFGVRTVMTRETEKIEYSDTAGTIRQKKTEDQKNRVSLIENTKNSVLISIHQNKYPKSGPFGAQVLFSENFPGEALADIMQKTLVEALNRDNYRSASKIPDDVYLMKKVTCPAILIECGFLSNPHEEVLLNTIAYRLKVAAAIAAGYLKSEKLLAESIFGGTNEG